MSFHIFNGLFSGRASNATMEKYGIEDSDLLGMISRDFYASLANPKVRGPAGMLDSLLKEKQEEQKEIAIQQRSEAWALQNERICYNKTDWNRSGDGDAELASRLAHVLCEWGVE